MLIGEYNKSVILTYLGICISIIGVVEALEYKFDMAFIALVLAGIIDLFDGVVARRCVRSEEAKLFGVQIDSLADTISFLVLPTIILFKLHEGLADAFLLGIICLMCIYTLSGIIRLAYFNVHVESMRSYYLGVPVTYIALVLPLYYLITKVMPGACFGYFIIYIMFSLAFILRIKIKKPDGIWYVIFSILAITTIIGILLI